MKFDKTTIGSLMAWFIWSIFMGVTAISIGIGAIFPPLNYIAGPFVCPGGQMTYATHSFQVSPVTSGYTLAYSCVNVQTGAQTDPGFWPIHLIVGLIFGLLLFLVVYRVWYSITLAGQRKKAADADWQRKWNEEFGHKKMRT